MKHTLYSIDEKIIVTDEELTEVMVIREYKRGIIKVNYKGRNMYYISNPNWNPQSQFSYEPHFRILIAFVEGMKMDIDEIFRMSEMTKFKMFQLSISTIFNVLFISPFSLKDRFYMIFVSLPSFLKFFATIKELKSLLEQ